jgi:hypothetical protein
MQVSNYQMHNVLECYSKKLSRARTPEQSADGGPKKMPEETVWPPESGRQATMAKISQQVLDKVTDVVALSRCQEKTPPELSGPHEDAAGGAAAPAAEFTFNVIDSVNRKRISRLAVGDPAALVRRLDQMAEKTGASKIESWV